MYIHVSELMIRHGESMRVVVDFIIGMRDLGQNVIECFSRLLPIQLPPLELIQVRWEHFFRCPAHLLVLLFRILPEPFHTVCACVSDRIDKIGGVIDPNVLVRRHWDGWNIDEV